MLRLNGASLKDRMAGMKTVLSAVLKTVRDQRQDKSNDPLALARETISSDPKRLQELEEKIEAEISDILKSAMAEAQS
jgi:hypothetical protein